MAHDAAGYRGLKANSHSDSFAIGKNLHVGKVHTKRLLGYLRTNLAFLQKQGITPLFVLGTWLDTSLSLLILLASLRQ